MFFIRSEAVNISPVPGEMKSYFQDDNNLPYFSEMDSYYNLRMTQDFLDHGYLGDTIKNGTKWDLHSFFPPGRSAEYPPMIVYVTAFIYKFVNIFGQIPLSSVAFWTGALIASLCVIPAFFFIRRVTNDYGGITAALLVGLSPFYVSHTFGGFFDTDMFNMLMPLLVVWFFSESISATESRNKMIFAALSALSMGLFSLSWEGWWLTFYVVIFATIFYLLASKYIFNMETFKSFSEYPNKLEWFKNQPVIFPLVIFIVLSVLLIFLVWGADATGSFLGPIGAIQIQSSTVATTQYPNVFITVKELEVPSLGKVMDAVGGIIPFAIAILGVLLVLWIAMQNSNLKKTKIRKKPDKKHRRRRRRRMKDRQLEKESEHEVATLFTPENKRNCLYYFFLLAVWLLITGYSFTKGVRFVEGFALPIALSAGLFVGFMKEFLANYISSPKGRNVAMILFVFIVCVQPLYIANETTNTVVPGTDDAMVNSLTWIKANTTNDTVITSWWDFGHLFAVKADRGVTFDGGSQNNGRAYWVGKALLTSDENLAAGILRMLASSGDNGYVTLENYTKDTGKSVEILNKILPVDKNTANNILITQYGMTSDQAQNILQYTHPDKPTPDVFITSMDMAGKSGAWSYFGNWNFNNKNSTGYVYSIAQANATQLNNSTVSIQASNNVVAQINENNITAGIMTKNNSTVAPHRLIIMNNGTKAYDQVVNNQSTFSIILVKQDDSLIAVAMQRELEDSMFTRLFFMQGEGLTHFKLAKQEPHNGQPEVMVWNVKY